MSILFKMQKDRDERRMRNWQNRLAYCFHCDEEYTDAEVILVNGDESCPRCKKPERKTYYYCVDHGSNIDDCEKSSWLL